MTSSRLKNPICEQCVVHYSTYTDTTLNAFQTEHLIESASSLPRALLKLPGVGQLLDDESLTANVSGDDSETLASSLSHATKASQILSQAQIQKGNASTYRLGQKARTVGASTTSSTSTRPHPPQKNLERANLIQAERKQRREETKTLETNIRVSITGWLHEKPKKLTQVCVGLSLLVLYHSHLPTLRFLYYPMSRHFRQTHPHESFSTLCWSGYRQHGGSNILAAIS